ncbi:hypothetical protein [Methylomonas fluvii]|nr:hypothetical protein [Methylomonas fluvii]
MSKAAGVGPLIFSRHPIVAISAVTASNRYSFATGYAQKRGIACPALL